MQALDGQTACFAREPRPWFGSSQHIAMLQAVDGHLPLSIGVQGPNRVVVDNRPARRLHAVRTGRRLDAAGAGKQAYALALDM